MQEHLTKGGDTSSPWRSIVLRLGLSDETAIAPTLERLNSEMHDMLVRATHATTCLVLPGAPPSAVEFQTTCSLHLGLVSVDFAGDIQQR